MVTVPFNLQFHRKLVSIFCRGFLGKRNDYNTTECIESFSDFIELDKDETREVTLLCVSEDERFIIASHKPKVEPAGKNQSVVLAAMTTAWARLALYQVIADYAPYVLCKLIPFSPL